MFLYMLGIGIMALGGYDLYRNTRPGATDGVIWLDVALIALGAFNIVMRWIRTRQESRGNRRP